MLRVAVLLALLAGCAADGRALPAWTLEVDGSAQAISLPTTFAGELPERELDYTLRARVPLEPAERGGPLTLVFGCYHGPLAVRAGTARLDDIGDTGVGEHRFIVPAAATGGGEVTFEATAHQDPETVVVGMSEVPRLLPGVHTAHAASARFDRAFNTATCAVIVALGILFAMLYVYDRRRSASAWFGVMAVAAAPALLWELGLTPFWVATIAIAVAALGLLQFVHIEFELDRAPRWIMVALLFVMPAAVASSLSVPCARAYFYFAPLPQLLFWSHMCRLLWRLARTSPRRQDAIALLVAVGAFLVAYTPAEIMISGGPAAFRGWHLEGFGVMAWVLATSAVLARVHVARQRTLEATAAELRHQIAERSRELADALAQLGRVPAALGEGRTIAGRYRVIRRLGAGGMGTVYEVERTTDGQRLALKTLRGRVDGELMARFAREAQLAAELQHANLVPVLDVGIADGVLYLVMELIGGGSLEQARARFGDPAWARPILAATADGLAAIHARGIVHRDLKPANILLAAGVPRIADFGLAVLRGTTDAHDTAQSIAGGDDTLPAARHLTGAGDVLGTPSYMAPELADGARAATAASDVFAFGVLAFELLTGRRPFDEAPITAIAAGHAIGVPATDGLPPIVARCLAIDAAARPASADLAAAFH